MAPDFTVAPLSPSHTPPTCPCTCCAVMLLTPVTFLFAHHNCFVRETSTSKTCKILTVTFFYKCGLLSECVDPLDLLYSESPSSLLDDGISASFGVVSKQSSHVRLDVLGMLDESS